jgi:predicted glutamine amidotransferase
MCRMFGYAGDSRDDLVRLVSALKRSAEHDELEPEPSRNKHEDGWGCVLCSSGGTSYERRTNAIFREDDDLVPDISGTTCAIFHARQASDKAMIGDRKYSHPFREQTEDETVFLAHNGSLRKRDVAAELSPPVDSEGKVDSEIGLKYVLQERRRGRTLNEAAEELQRFVRRNRALNLLMLEVPKSGPPELYVKHYYMQDLSNSKEKDRTDYYNLHYQRLSGGVAVFSSTLTRVDPRLRRAPVLPTDELTPVSQFS